MQSATPLGDSHSHERERRATGTDLVRAHARLQPQVPPGAHVQRDGGYQHQEQWRREVLAPGILRAESGAHNQLEHTLNKVRECQHIAVQVGRIRLKYVRVLHAVRPTTGQVVEDSRPPLRLHRW